MARKSVSEVKVELSDDTGFDDASGCNEFKGDVEDHITQDDVRIDLKSGEPNNNEKAAGSHNR